MESKLLSLPPGETELIITDWKFTANGDIQIIHKSKQRGYRPVYRTFKGSEEFEEYLLVVLERVISQPTPRELNSLKGKKILVDLTHGKRGFMNLTKVLKVVGSKPIFNSSFPVNELESGAPELLEVRGQDVGQA